MEAISSEKQLLELKLKVTESPFISENHDELINILRLQKRERIDELLAARQDKLLHFALTPKEISEWLEDLNSIGDPDIKFPAIIDFYIHVIEDYPIVDYWRRYIEFALNLYKETDNYIDDDWLKSLFTQALNASVYDFKNSGEIWTVVLDFFTNSYEASKRDDDFQVLLKLHLKRISYPHETLDKSFAEFSVFVSKYDNTNYEEHMLTANKIYSRTQKQQRYYEEFEIRLLEEPKNVKLWIDYIEQVNKYSGNVGQLSTLFYRSLMSGGTSKVNDHEWIPVWLTYIYSLYQENTEQGPFLEQTLLRFVRSHPGSAISYAEYIRNCQIFENSTELFSMMKSRLIAIDLQHKNSYEDWKTAALAILSYEFYVIRNLKNFDFVQELYTDLTDFVDFAINESIDIFHSVEKLSVSILEELDDVDQARTIIKKLLVKFSNECEIWLYANDFERRQGSGYEVISNLFKEAVNQFNSLDWPERIFQEWLHLEQIHGDVNSHKAAIVKVNNALRALDAKRLEEHVISEERASKRKLEDEENNPKKRLKAEEDPKRSREKYTVRISNLPENIYDYDLRRFFEDCGTIRNIEIFRDEQDTICAVVEFSSDQQVFAALTKDKKKLNDRVVAVTRLLGCTLWVTNYPPSMSSDDILALFNDLGKVVSIRFPTQKGRKGRRFCYVQYANPEIAQKALLTLKNKELLDGISDKKYTLKVEISDPSTSKPREGPIEDREVRVSNINMKTVDEYKLKDLFQECGSVEKVTLPLSNQRRVKGYKNNGYGFILFASISAVERALKLNGHVLDSRRIEVSEVAPIQLYPSDFGDLHTISVLNLSDTTTAQQLRSFFIKNVGPVKKVETYPDHESALIEFTKASDAGRAAMLLSSSKFDGQPLELGSKDDYLRRLRTQENENPPKKQNLMIPPILKRRRK